MAIGYLDSAYLTDIADAIRSKDGSQNTYTPSQMPQAILDIPTGGGSIENPAVRFLDFDGTIVEELTDQELTDLTSLPSAPDHSHDEIPLTFDEWNWLLADIKTFRTANPTWTVNVGANYHTTDGKVHFIWEIEYDNFTTMILFDSSGCDYELDWGDGTVEQVHVSGSNQQTHTFTTKGNYHLTITPLSQTAYLQKIGLEPLQGNGNYHFLTEMRFPSTIELRGYGAGRGCWFDLRDISVPSNHDRCFTTERNRLKWISIPRGANTQIIIKGQSLKYWPMLYSTTLTSTSFESGYCTSLEEIYVPSYYTSLYSNCMNYNTSLKRVHIPNTITSIPIACFNYCGSLREVDIPSSVTSIADMAFAQCYSLEKVTLPPNITTISQMTFYACMSLKKIEIPDSVTSIGNYTFYNAPLEVLIMKPATPPTLGSAVFADGLGAPGRIIVPYSADHSILNAYQTATNWSSYASRMVEEEPTT